MNTQRPSEFFCKIFSDYMNSKNPYSCDMLRTFLRQRAKITGNWTLRNHPEGLNWDTKKKIARSCGDFREFRRGAFLNHTLYKAIKHCLKKYCVVPDLKLNLDSAKDKVWRLIEFLSADKKLEYHYIHNLIGSDYEFIRCNGDNTRAKCRDKVGFVKQNRHPYYIDGVPKCESCFGKVVIKDKRKEHRQHNKHGYDQKDEEIQQLEEQYNVTNNRRGTRVSYKQKFLEMERNYLKSLKRNERMMSHIFHKEMEKFYQSKYCFYRYHPQGLKIPCEYQHQEVIETPRFNSEGVEEDYGYKTYNKFTLPINQFRKFCFKHIGQRDQQALHLRKEGCEDKVITYHKFSRNDFFYDTGPYSLEPDWKEKVGFNKQGDYDLGLICFWSYRPRNFARNMAILHYCDKNPEELRKMMINNMLHQSIWNQSTQKHMRHEKLDGSGDFCISKWDWESPNTFHEKPYKGSNHRATIHTHLTNPCYHPCYRTQWSSYGVYMPQYNCNSNEFRGGSMPNYNKFSLHDIFIKGRMAWCGMLGDRRFDLDCWIKPKMYYMLWLFQQILNKYANYYPVRNFMLGRGIAEGFLSC
jgi:hypothetical protein